MKFPRRQFLQWRQPLPQCRQSHVRPRRNSGPPPSRSPSWCRFRRGPRSIWWRGWSAQSSPAALGQPVVIENRTGANGMIGSNAGRARGARRLHAADDHGQHPCHRRASDEEPSLRSDQGLHADHRGGRAGDLPGGHAALPVNSVPELIAYAKAHPDELSYGSSGVGSVFHLMGELFNRDRRRQDQARALSGRRAGDAGRHRRPHPDGLHLVSNARGAPPAGKVKILAVLEPQRYSHAACAVDVRDHPGVPQAVVLVRLLRTGRAAAGRSSRGSMPKSARRSMSPR